MLVVKNELVRPCDVDGTLVIHDHTKCHKTVQVFDPATKKWLTMGVNVNMVRLLVEEKHRGGYVIVWSRGGYEWAKNVVLALNLENVVDLVMSKPLAYYDDTPVKKWMKDRVFIEPNVIYKNCK